MTMKVTQECEEAVPVCNVVHEERCGPQHEQQQDCLVVEQKKCSLVQDEKCETQYSQAHWVTPAPLS